MSTELSRPIMRLMRMRGALLVLAVAVATGCSSGSSHSAAEFTAASESSPGSPLSPEQICRQTLGSEVLLAWAPGTVAEFRLVVAVRHGAREVGGRRDAIAAAVAEAGSDDIILLAGKGHEQGQIVGDRVLPFDDALVARECAT